MARGSGVLTDPEWLRWRGQKAARASHDVLERIVRITDPAVAVAAERAAARRVRELTGATSAAAAPHQET
jgi:hypothetical protein